MTRQHFNAIANAIQESYGDTPFEMKRQIVINLSKQLLRFNVNFDQIKFMEVCLYSSQKAA